MTECENLATRRTRTPPSHNLSGARHRRRRRDARQLRRLLDASTSTGAGAVLCQVVERLAESLLREAVAHGEVDDEEDEVRELRDDEDPSESESRVSKAACACQ